MIRGALCIHSPIATICYIRFLLYFCTLNAILALFLASTLGAFSMSTSLLHSIQGTTELNQVEILLLQDFVIRLLFQQPNWQNQEETFECSLLSSTYSIYGKARGRALAG